MRRPRSILPILLLLCGAALAACHEGGETAAKSGDNGGGSEDDDEVSRATPMALLDGRYLASLDAAVPDDLKEVTVLPGALGGIPGDPYGLEKGVINYVPVGAKGMKDYHGFMIAELDAYFGPGGYFHGKPLPDRKDRKPRIFDVTGVVEPQTIDTGKKFLVVTPLPDGGAFDHEVEIYYDSGAPDGAFFRAVEIDVAQHDGTSARLHMTFDQPLAASPDTHIHEIAEYDTASHDTNLVHQLAPPTNGEPALQLFHLVERPGDGFEIQGASKWLIPSLSKCVPRYCTVQPGDIELYVGYGATQAEPKGSYPIAQRAAFLPVEVQDHFDFKASVAYFQTQSYAAEVQAAELATVRSPSAGPATYGLSCATDGAALGLPANFCAGAAGVSDADVTKAISATCGKDLAKAPPSLVGAVCEDWYAGQMMTNPQRSLIPPGSTARTLILPSQTPPAVFAATLDPVVEAMPSLDFTLFKQPMAWPAPAVKQAAEFAGAEPQP